MPAFSTLVACILVAAVAAQVTIDTLDDVGARLTRYVASLVARSTEVHSLDLPDEEDLVLFVGAFLRCLSIVGCCMMAYLEMEARGPQRRAANLLYAGTAVYLFVNFRAILAELPPAATEAVRGAIAAIAAATTAVVRFLATRDIPSSMLPEVRELREFVRSALEDEGVRKTAFALAGTLFVAMCVVERKDRTLRALRLFVARWVFLAFDAHALRTFVCDAESVTPPYVCRVLDAMHAMHPGLASTAGLLLTMIAADRLVCRVSSA